MFLICHYSNCFKFVMPFANCFTCSSAFGTNRWTVRTIFDVATGCNCAIRQTNRCANFETTVWTEIIKFLIKMIQLIVCYNFAPVRKRSGFDGRIYQFLSVIVCNNAIITREQFTKHTILIKMEWKKKKQFLPNLLNSSIWFSLFPFMIVVILLSSRCFNLNKNYLHQWYASFRCWLVLVWTDNYWKMVKWAMETTTLYTRNVCDISSIKISCEK